MTADVRNPQLCSAALKFDLESLKSQKIFSPGKGNDERKNHCEVLYCTAGNMLAVVGYFFPGAGYEQADSVFPREIVYTSEKP